MYLICIVIQIVAELQQPQQQPQPQQQQRWNNMNDKSSQYVNVTEDKQQSNTQRTKEEEY